MSIGAILIIVNREENTKMTREQRNDLDVYNHIIDRVLESQQRDRARVIKHLKDKRSTMTTKQADIRGYKLRTRQRQLKLFKTNARIQALKNKKSA